MTDDLEKLKRDYRKIKAPPYLATRVHAELAQAPTQRRKWVPAAVAITSVAIAVIAVGTVVVRQQPAQTMTSPSLAALTRMTPRKPAVPAPSLSKLRSVKIPTMPTKPKLTQPNDQQTYFDFENEVLKETDYEYI